MIKAVQLNLLSKTLPLLLVLLMPLGVFGVGTGSTISTSPSGAVTASFDSPIQAG